MFWPPNFNTPDVDGMRVISTAVKTTCELSDVGPMSDSRPRYSNMQPLSDRYQCNFLYRADVGPMSEWRLRYSDMQPISGRYGHVYWVVIFRMLPFMIVNPFASALFIHNLKVFLCLFQTQFLFKPFWVTFCFTCKRV